jgi:hypothetical protein
MRRARYAKAVIAVGALMFGGLVAGAATAQSWSGYNQGQGHRYDRGHDRGYRHDFNGQADVPGDYRCDAYWDRGRTDCGAGWRDQRRYASQGSWNRGHGHRYDQGHGRYAYGRGHGQGWNGRNQGAGVYPGAYGRPDLVYPGGGRSHGYTGGRDPGRIDWCRASYRSYDPSSGYYRAYSGRLIFCG